MPQTRKIATCCYCGTRAVLVLNRARHELACSACGAPLHEMKAMPVPQGAAKAAPRQSPAPEPRYRPEKFRIAEHRAPSRKGKRKKRKSLTRYLVEELWDVVEDIFD